MLNRMKRPIDETGASCLDSLLFIKVTQNAKMTASQFPHRDKLSSLPEACWQSRFARQAEAKSLCLGCTKAEVNLGRDAGRLL